MKKEKSCVFLEEKSIRYFESAEEVWFWFCFCESTPKCRMKSSDRKVRPCETSDIAIILKRLIANKILKQDHLKILSLYGLKQIVPSERCGEPAIHCFLWNEAMKKLSDVFCVKGIIENNLKAASF